MTVGAIIAINVVGGVEATPLESDLFQWDPNW